MISEADGCALLAKVFERRGYRVARETMFREANVDSELDGWDAQARVGFEYLVRSEGDHDDLTEPEQLELAERMERGELYVLIVDEVTEPTILELAAERFLDEVERRRGAKPAPAAQKKQATASPKSAKAAAPKKAAPKQKKAQKRKQRAKAKAKAPQKKAKAKAARKGAKKKKGARR